MPKINENFDSEPLKASHQLRSLEFKHQGMALNQSIACNDIQGAKYKLGDLVKSKQKLIFCIPEGVCNTCHENTFKQLTAIGNIFGKENLLVLVPSSKLRETLVEFKDRGSNLSILGVNYKELRINIGFVPFLFILSNKFLYENLFVPSSFDPKLTNDYLIETKNRYFSNNS